MIKTPLAAGFWVRISGDSLERILAHKRISVQTQFRASTLDARTGCDPRRPLAVAFLRSIRRWKANLSSALCRSYAVLRSFRGHIGILFSRAETRIDLGPSFQLQDGRYRENMRTLARAEGIQRLLATHPWSDSADLRIFLMGVDAGEEHCRANPQGGGGSPELHSAQTMMRQ